MTITKEQIRAYIATPKGKLLVACALLALCWLTWNSWKSLPTAQAMQTIPLR